MYTEVSQVLRHHRFPLPHSLRLSAQVSLLLFQVQAAEEYQEEGEVQAAAGEEEAGVPANFVYYLYGYTLHRTG